MRASLTSNSKLHFSFNFLTNFPNHLSVTVGQHMKTGSHALLGGRVSGTTLVSSLKPGRVEGTPATH